MRNPMARAIYTHELADPDFSWLIQNFRENNPSYGLIEISGVPLVLLEDPSVREGEAIHAPPTGADTEGRDERSAEKEG